MRDITNNIQRLLAEKIINDTLFMAKMGQLTSVHRIHGETNNTYSTDCPSPQHLNTNYSNFPSTFPQSQVHYETLSPVTTNDNSNQSIASYISNFSDA